MPFGGKTDARENATLDNELGSGTPASVYFGLATSISGDGTITEVANAGAYARVTVTNNATNFPAASGGQKQNANAITWAQASANWAADPTRIMAWFIADSGTYGGGNVREYGLFIGTAYVFTALASSDFFTCYGTTFTNGQKVKVAPVFGAGDSLPTGVSEYTTYYIVGVSGNTFQLSATSGGSAINITANGAGLVALDLAQECLNGNTFSIPALGLTLSED